MKTIKDIIHLKNNNVTSFWNNLINAELEKESRILNLKERSIFREDYTNLYVRKSYEDLYELIKNDEPFKTVLIKGSQGIGKTVFIVYYLFRKRLEEDKTKLIIVDRVANGTFCLGYDENGIPVGYLGIKDDFIRMLYNGDENIIYICDGQPPLPIHQAFLLILSYPNKENYHAQMKTGNTEAFIMPLWKEEELLDSGTLIYKQQENDIKKRYQIFGGIPRYVFERINEEQLSIIKKEIKSSDIKSLYKWIYQIDSDISNLVHFESINNYNNRKVIVASPYIMKKLIIHFMKNDREKLKEKILYYQCYEELSIELYIEVSHQILKKGGNFKIKKLKDENEIKYTSSSSSSDLIDISESNQLLNVNNNNNFELNLSSQDGEYYRTNQINNPEVNSIKGNNLFIITPSKSHPVIFTNLIHLLPKQYNEFNLIFVVSPLNYAQFNYQEYIDENGKKIDSPLNVTQYALLMEFQ